MTEASRAFAGEHGAMNNWDKIWKKRTAKIENRATVFEMFKELKRADGGDTQEVQGYYEAFFRQWECMAQRIETGCAGTIGSLYEIGCGSGVNLYLFSTLKHVAVLGGLDYSKNLIRIAQSVVTEADVRAHAHSALLLSHSHSDHYCKEVLTLPFVSTVLSPDFQKRLSGTRLTGRRCWNACGRRRGRWLLSPKCTIRRKKTNTWHTAGSVSRIMMKYMRGWTKHFTPERCSCNLQRSTGADVRSYNLITNCTGITGLCLIAICIKNNA